jgi:GT2 family glycosyltransferase
MPPLVSFLIATRNRGSVLVDSLKRVAACGLAPTQFEIIVVDNASTDGTPDLLAQQLPAVQLIRLENNRGPVAKNHALAVATGEFAVFLDDDAYPLPGSVPQMIRHFRDDPRLAAAVFDVTLPDGNKECSAYPDVFIGAGTGFRRDLIIRLGGLPQEFFMQAEEYDLSFRILAAGGGGGRIKRFADLPLVHLKTPGARIATRTTRLDIRNNLYLLAKYIPAPLCFTLAGDWLTRYFFMSQARDSGTGGQAHKQAYLQGSAEGLAKWSTRRAGNRHLLAPAVIEQIFKIDATAQRLRQAQARLGFKNVIFADLGKNIHAYLRAAERLHLPVLAIADDYLATSAGDVPNTCRGVPVIPWQRANTLPFDAIVVSNLSPVHAERRTAALRRTHRQPVLNLFGPTAPSFVRR